MRLLAAVAALALIAAAPAAPTFDDPRPSSQPVVGAPSVTGGIAEMRISFALPGGATMRGIAIEPADTAGRHPAILWGHWLGDPPTTNHTEFAADARALARRGVISLLLDMPWSQERWFEAHRAPATDAADTVAQVVALRRALDALAALPGVDASRIAYVGHDFSAMDGALLLAVDDRPAYAVLMTPALSFWEWYLLGDQPADAAAYVAQMSAFDLPGWLARGRQRATLLQFASEDEYVAPATASVVRRAVPSRDRTVKTYKTGHALDVPAAHDDRIEWLASHLNGTGTAEARTAGSGSVR